MKSGINPENYITGKEKEKLMNKQRKPIGKNPVASSAILEGEEGGKDAVSWFLNNFCYALSCEM